MGIDNFIFRNFNILSCLYMTIFRGLGNFRQKKNRKQRGAVSSMSPLVRNCTKSFPSPKKLAQVAWVFKLFPQNSSAVKPHLFQGTVKYAYLYVIIKVVVLLGLILAHAIYLLFKTRILYT